MLTSSSRPESGPVHRTPADLRRRLFAAVLIVTVMLAAALGGAYHWVQGEIAKRSDEVRSHALLAELAHVQTAFEELQSTEREYVQTGRAELRDTFRVTRARMDAHLAKARDLSALTVEQARALDALSESVREQVEIAQATMGAQDNAGLQTVQSSSAAHDITAVARIRAGFRSLEASETQRLAVLSAQIAKRTNRSGLMWVGAAGAMVLALFGVFSYLHRQAASRHRAEIELRRTIGDQNRVLYEVSAMGTMMELLQSCRSQGEANVVMGDVLPKLLPNHTGALYVLRSSKNMLELQARWGSGNTVQIFAPDDCWALRRSRTHLVEHGRSAIVCRHIEGQHQNCVCVPLVAHGESMGVLHLSSSPEQSISPEVLRLASVLAEQLSLALGNLRLQETLRNRSERDPLTDLYNRRHLELSLERELARATRNKQPVSFIMLDVDHFKKFNDSHGHDAGDAVLRNVGQVLKRHTRTEDIVCRFGGEEFFIVLPGCDNDEAYLKAEAIREAISQMTVNVGGAALPRVTASLGLSAYPIDGTQTADLLKAADAALYRAKAAGRNCIVANGAPGEVTLFEPTLVKSRAAA